MEKKLQNVEQEDQGMPILTSDLGAREKRTDVLYKNVSRETILSGTDAKKLYRLFRKNKINRRESLYNALYLVCNNKYEQSKTDLRSKYKSVHLHPVSWSADKNKMHRNNVWSVGMAFLRGVASIHSSLRGFWKKCRAAARKLRNIPLNIDNSMHAAGVAKRVMKRFVFPLMAITFGIFTFFVIANAAKDDYTVGIYIDGEYAGNTSDMNGVLQIKHQYEQSLSESYGVPVVFDCSVEFVPQKLDEKSYYEKAQLFIFDDYVNTFTEPGYGLYIDGKLVAVTENETWLDRAVDDYIVSQRKFYMQENFLSEKSTQSFVYNNYITVVLANYPESFFISHSELRKMFGLEEAEDEVLYDLHYLDKKPQGQANKDGSFSYSLSLDVAAYAKEDALEQSQKGGVFGTGGGTENAVTVDIAMVKEESVRAVVPYSETLVPDETLPEGVRRLVSEGKNGEKLVVYKNTYQGKKLMGQEVIREEITKLPENKVIRVGTKEPTEQELAAMPTGTYIYPYNGVISSDYGWRILRGQNNFHQGLDIYGPKGSELVASDGGQVIEVGYSGGYGKYCKIQHNEDVVTRYAHCKSILVEAGDYVAQGDVIATMGDTGNVTGVHVHFEIIKNGTTVDPLPYMNGEELPRG